MIKKQAPEQTQASFGGIHEIVMITSPSERKIGATTSIAALNDKEFTRKQVNSHPGTSSTGWVFAVDLDVFSSRATVAFIASAMFSARYAGVFRPVTTAG